MWPNVHRFSFDGQITIKWHISKHLKDLLIFLIFWFVLFYYSIHLRAVEMDRQWNLYVLSITFQDMLINYTSLKHIFYGKEIFFFFFFFYACICYSHTPNNYLPSTIFMCFLWKQNNNKNFGKFLWKKRQLWKLECLMFCSKHYSIRNESMQSLPIKIQTFIINCFRVFI